MWPNIGRDFIPMRLCLQYWIPAFFIWNKNIPVIVFLWNNIPLNYVSGKKGEFGFSAVITAARNEYYPGSSKGKGNRCRRYAHGSVAATHNWVGMGLENGMHWINTQNSQKFANHVGVNPQCCICKCAGTNSSKGILCPCYLFSINICSYTGMLMKSGRFSIQFVGFFTFPFPCQSQDHPLVDNP